MKQTTDTGPQLTRRHFLGIGLACITAIISAACRGKRIKEDVSITRDKQKEQVKQVTDEARLIAHPIRVTKAAPRGLQKLGLGTKRDGLLYIPSGYRVNHPAPLVLMLHGAGGNAHHSLVPFQHYADAAGLILLAPDSRGRTWDIILGQYGPDITFINEALAQTFDRYAVDPKHMGIGGFSDGASYALSLGITNGDLFTHVIAFSPGFMSPTGRHGSPSLFISHGKKDRVLPIDECSRRIVPQLKRAGYDVIYREFDGPHTVPPEIVREAISWFTMKPV